MRARPDRARHLEPCDLGQPDPGRARGGAGDRRSLELLADVAGKAGIAWERLFDAPEEKSLRTLRYELDLTESTIAKLEGRIRELQESPTLGFTTFLDTTQISALDRKLDELRRARDQTQARIAFLEGPPDTGTPAPVSAPAPDDTAGVQERAKNLERIARELEGTLFSITHEGSAQIIAEHERGGRRGRGAAGQGRHQCSAGRPAHRPVGGGAGCPAFAAAGEGGGGRREGPCGQRARRREP
jgi:hypothetical protein